jgi:phosphate transport system permease protein
MRRIDPRITEKVVVAGLWSCALGTVGLLVLILGYIIVKGVGAIRPDFFLREAADMGRSGGILPFLASTAAVTAVALLAGIPLGIGTAVYLAEYTRQGPVTRLIRFGVDCLAGIPSIVLGLFGFLFFVITLDFGWSILSGGLTVSLMILPFIIRSSEEAILAVPRPFREAAFAAGATKWQVVTHVVLPGALPGIVTGVILGIGKCVGETASVIFTAGCALRMPLSLFDSGRTLAVHFYILVREGISENMAYGSAAVLCVAILAINFSAYAAMRWILRRKYS